jgi:hypothetical protein
MFGFIVEDGQNFVSFFEEAVAHLSASHQWAPPMSAPKTGFDDA